MPGQKEYVLEYIGGGRGRCIIGAYTRFRDLHAAAKDYVERVQPYYDFYYQERTAWLDLLGTSVPLNQAAAQGAYYYEFSKMRVVQRRKCWGKTMEELAAEVAEMVNEPT